jgi:xanthine dehydrogenase accessory factor
MRKRVVVRGGGDIASGTIQKLFRAGFDVAVLELPNPSFIRRNVCYGMAVLDGETELEGIKVVLVNGIEEMEKAFAENKIAVLVDPEGKLIEKIKPVALVDGILAKKNLGTHRGMAPATVALGPGFTAGKDVDIVIETQRGHDLGRLIFTGDAIKNTGIPGDIKGFSKERVIHSPASGNIKNIRDIGDLVEAGETIATIGDTEVKTEIAGVLRGLIRDGYPVEKGLKIADVDPRKEEVKNCFTISDKARNIGGSALEAVMMLIDKRK